MAVMHAVDRIKLLVESTTLAISNIHPSDTFLFFFFLTSLDLAEGSKKNIGESV